MGKYRYSVYIYIYMFNLIKKYNSFLIKGRQTKIVMMKDYIMFWKTYSKFIYSEFGRLRSISIRDFNNAFKKSTFCIENFFEIYIYIYIYILHCI